MEQQRFLFSVVMPVYNVEDYLEEAINSLINQTIGFEEHVQLILVNDESPDNSEAICERYSKQYPQNIIYTKQKNQGVSVARNTGIELATGTYINFLDSDDYFDEDTLEKVWGFLNEHGEDIDVVAIPLIYFEGKQGPHMLHYKFKESRIIDVTLEPDKFVMQSGSTFIHRTEGLGDLRFTPGQKFGEDASLLIDIVMKKKRYGVLNTTKYNYRARVAGTSALQSSKESYDYYLPFFGKYLLTKLEKYNQLYGYVPKYVQNVIMYDLQWRLRSKETPEVLKPDLDEFYSKIIDILQYIDEDVIVGQRYLNWYQKHAVCTMKQTKGKFDVRKGFYSTKVLNNSEGFKDLMVIDHNDQVVDSLTQRHLNIDLCEIEEGNLKVVGRVGSLLPQENMKVFITDSNNEIYLPQEFPFPLENRFLVGEVIYTFKGFEFEIPFEKIKNNTSIQVILEVEGIQSRADLKFSPSARLSHQLTNSYIVANNQYMIGFNHTNKQFEILPYTYQNMMKRELAIKKEMKKNKIKNYNKISRTRILIRTIKRNKKHSIHLYMDRIDKADDSAEVLMRYVNGLKETNVKNYFILDKQSPDFTRLQKEFNPIGYKTAKHKFLFLLADKLISTHCDRFIYQPFTGTENYFKDLKEYKFVFLQHGIIKDDMSNWLKRYDKNFKLFVTSAKLEYDSIVGGNYSFTDKQVKLTGLPRFDRLTDTSSSVKKKILVMPTWRQHLINEFSNKINARPYSETFKESDYFKRWNQFLNDPTVISYARANGYELVFVPHPSIRQQLVDFNLENVTLAPYEESYSSILTKGNLLITDYSSVYFDFAYMKKPMLYYHFDTGNWDNESGYFSYDEMGFGDIVTSHEALVSSVIHLLENDCLMSQKYQERVENFYPYTDQNNSERVHKEIMKL
ncbi:CDP-glycerol:glycerophosphate glycerophosphotransferase [Alkalicoccobacillus porphyridii]|uniref:Glycosyltransferase n=1 Tax=Alkalicoccobacillus porphyridii TaxID=2597270 RepID=A0A554A3Z9_9BACI|nr:CDP-glycerol glycerophosphotransferase family protein [Alkalicoccobacillus porphyridii]TSB48386.1 glycosyltransferase [Alkalicoccobacillus porphyridii]